MPGKQQQHLHRGLSYRPTGLRQYFRTFLFNLLSLGDDKYYCTSLPQFFRVLIPHPLQILQAIVLAAWMRFYRFPFVLIFFYFFIFAFETLKKSILCQQKVSAVGTGASC